jgi:molybdopterin-guanine dinucleotide biosynthesis protein A
MKDAAKISAVILAGGLARRMDGADKGLLQLHGLPLVARVITRIEPQVDELFISANRNIKQYAGFGLPVLCDEVEGGGGPLAGLQRAMREASHELILSVPCDMPLLPMDLAARLQAALLAEDAQIAVPGTGADTHHALMLCRRDVAQNLDAFLASGERRVRQWQASLKRVVVPFADADAFLNINTAEELERVADIIGQGSRA